MRTENDLRTAIEQLAAEGGHIKALPDYLVDELSASPPSAPPRHSARVLAPLLAALVIAAVAVLGVAVLGDRHPSDGTHVTGTKPVPLAWDFSVRHVPGYLITRGSVFRPSYPAADVVEGAGVTSAGRSKASGFISYNSLTSRTIKTADSTTINGVRYYFTAGRHVTRAGGLTRAQYAHPWIAVGQALHPPQLEWLGPNGSHFSIGGTFGFQPKTYNYDNSAARQIMLRIARAVRGGQHDPITRPFRLTGLAHGIVPVSLTTVAAPEQNIDALVQRQPLSACLSYAKPRHPSPIDPTQSLLSVCRVKPIGNRQRTLQAIGFDSPDAIARQYIRRLPDHTLLAIGVPKGYSRLFTHAQLRAIAETSDVTPSLAKPDTWLKVN